jgi:hypothetical protein
MNVKKSIAIAAGALGLALLYCALTESDRKMLKQVKNGEKYLICNFKDGERVVNPDVITGFNDGVWIFDNGYAKNCRVIA